MKLTPFILPALSAGLLLSSCEKPAPGPDAQKVDSKPEKSTPAASAAVESPAIDADKLLQGFSSAGPEEKSRVGKAAQAIRAESYSAAREILEHLLKEGHLTPEQKELVTGFVAQLPKAK